MDETLVVESILKHLAGQHDQGKHRTKKAAHPWIAGLRVAGKEGKKRQAALAAKYAGKILTAEDRRRIKNKIINGPKAGKATPNAPEPLSHAIIRGLINYAVNNPEDVRAAVDVAGKGAKVVGRGAKKVWKKIDDPQNRAEWTEAERQAARKQRFWHPDNAADLDYRRNPQFYSGF